MVEGVLLDWFEDHSEGSIDGSLDLVGDSDKRVNRDATKVENPPVRGVFSRDKEAEDLRDL